jgi:hypothetical protein
MKRLLLALLVSATAIITLGPAPAASTEYYCSGQGMSDFSRPSGLC